MDETSGDLVSDHVQWVIAAATEEEATVFANDHQLRRASEWVWVPSVSREVRAYQLTPGENVVPLYPVGEGETYAPRRLPSQMIAGGDRARQRLLGRPLTQDERQTSADLGRNGTTSPLTPEASDELYRYVHGELTIDELETAALARIRAHFADQRRITEALARRQAAHQQLLRRLPLSLDAPIPLGVNYAWVRFFVQLADDAGLDIEHIDAVTAQIQQFTAGLDAGHLPPFRPELEDREKFIERLVDDGPEWPDRRDEAIRLLLDGGAI